MHSELDICYVFSRQLKLSNFDPRKLKIMTGEWFDEMKCRRYGENYSVIDVVRYSFKRKRNPGGVTQGNFVTNLEERRRFQIIGEPARTPLLQTINPQSVSYSSVAQRHSSSLLTQTKNENVFDGLALDLANESQSQPAVIDVSSEGFTPLQITCSASVPAILEDNDLECDDDLSSVSSFGSDISAQKVSHSSNLRSVSGLGGSWMSLYSDAGDFGNLCIQGAVEFALLYRDVKRELVILVEQCQDLAIANVKKQRTDPYVKTYLYPEKSRLSKRKTSVKKNTVNPVYKEPLTYKMTKVELQTRTLNLSVWHNDSLGRNAFLGEVQIDLRTWDWRLNDLSWYNLQPKKPDATEGSRNRGQLTVALKYVPTGSIDGAKPATGELHVWLKEARNLKGLKLIGVDSFVKCYILPDTSKKGRQKTRVIKKSLNPIYNHTMVYDGFKHDEIKEACCELTIWDHDTFTNQYLGGVRLSLGTGKSYGRNMDWMDSADEEIEVWRSMISKPNGWVEAVLPLRLSMAKKK
ncbi:synaptotagmin-like protein 2 [Huso huso]|uniref:Synaptotagmin-like protein 2 n=1 Tax=Huso huso TaxID=61971 RepID=A0ABR0ZV85_HUSHU